MAEPESKIPLASFAAVEMLSAAIRETLGEARANLPEIGSPKFQAEYELAAAQLNDALSQWKNLRDMPIDRDPSVAQEIEANRNEELLSLGEDLKEGLKEFATLQEAVRHLPENTPGKQSMMGVVKKVTIGDFGAETEAILLDMNLNLLKAAPPLRQKPENHSELGAPSAAEQSPPGETAAAAAVRRQLQWVDKGPQAGEKAQTAPINGVTL